MSCPRTSASAPATFRAESANAPSVVEPPLAAKLRQVLTAYGLPVRIPSGLAPEGLLARMRLDKKNLAGRLRLVLWRGLGRAEVVPDVDESRVLAVLSG